MTSRKELRNRQSGDAATQVVGRQDRRSKESLIDPHANERFAASSLRERLRLHKELGSTTGDLTEQAFAFESQPIPVTAELVPYLNLYLRAVRGARDIPFLQSRIKPRKIGKLPRHRRRSATYRFRQLYHQRIADVNSTEEYFADVSGRDLGEMIQSRINLVVPIRIKGIRQEYEEAPNVISFENFFRFHLDPALDRWRAAGAI